ncbi:hypothetical protein PTKIN_Ptkin11bG0180500 [Pterospermum kingtungense]
MESSQMKNSKDRAFFFSMEASYAISCPANESGIEGGFVYYTSGTDKILYSFNIEDRSISICPPSTNFSPRSTPFWFIPDLRNFSPRSTPFWFIPDLRSINKKTEVNPIMKQREEEKQMETSFKLKSHSLSPWLIFADKGEYGRTLHTFIDPNLGGRYSMNIPECIIDFDIRYSKEGWLLMSSKVRGDLMFFYNPFIKQLVSVPPKPEWNPCHSPGFSCSPTSPDCIIVGIPRSISGLSVWKEGEWHLEP